MMVLKLVIAVGMVFKALTKRIMNKTQKKCIVSSSFPLFGGAYFSLYVLDL